MQFSKQEILDLLHRNGQHQKADQASQSLPDPVDDQRHAGQLQNVGIDPQDLHNQLGGGGGGSRL